MISRTNISSSTQKTPTEILLSYAAILKAADAWLLTAFTASRGLPGPGAAASYLQNQNEADVLTKSLPPLLELCISSLLMYR